MDIFGVIAVLMVAVACLLGGWLLARTHRSVECRKCEKGMNELIRAAFSNGREGAQREFSERLGIAMDRASLGKPASSPPNPIKHGG